MSFCEFVTNDTNMLVVLAYQVMFIHIVQITSII